MPATAQPQASLADRQAPSQTDRHQASDLRQIDACKPRSTLRAPEGDRCLNQDDGATVSRPRAKPRLTASMPTASMPERLTVPPQPRVTASQE